MTSTDPCGFCLEATNTTRKNKRKLLNRPACEVETALLKKVLSQFRGGRNFGLFWDVLVHSSTYLCDKCQSLLKKQRSLETDLAEVNANIKSKCETLFNARRDVPPPPGRSLTEDRRPRSESLVEATTPTSSSSPSDSVDVSVIIKRRAGPGRVAKAVKHTITPSRKKPVVSLATGRYRLAAKSVFFFTKTHNYVITSMARQIRLEMKEICGLKNKSLLRSGHGGIEHFSWSEIWEEFTLRVPTLVKILQKLLPQSSNMFLSCIICLLLKERCKHMSLLQQVISVLLYGHGTSQQVYRYLQPLMMCMSPSSTVDIITKISKQYDSRVLNWTSELKKRLVPTQQSQSTMCTLVDLSADEDSDYSVGDISLISECESVQVGDPEDDDDDDMNLEEEVDIFQLGAGDQGVSEDTGISVVEHSSTDIPDDIIMQLFEEVDNQQCTEVDLTPTLPNVEGIVQMESEAPVEPVAIANTDTYGYVLVIDNLDMNVRRSFQRLDRTTQSMHLCHAYAALNRIDTSGLEDGSMSGILSPAVVLPNAQDLQRLIDDFKVFISRMLVRHHPDFAGHQVFVDWYIDSEHSDKMSKKSVVVPLGVQLHNENKLNEMTRILLALNKYVPCNTVETSVHVDGEKYTQEETQLGPRLIFGDQLTSARVRGATALRCFHKTSLTRLEGYIPVTSDWHARLCYVTVLQNRFYSTTPQDKGTLFQLKQIINRTSFGKVPKQNMKAAEDFLDVVLCAHVLTAAEQVMESPENGSVHLDCKAVANLITEQFVKISIPQLEEESIDATSTAGNDGNPISVPLLSTDATPGDSVYTYATDFLTTALLWYGFHDAIKMGDGSRITTYWKFLTAIFNQTGHCNYAKEGFLMLAQSSLLSPRMSAELKWSRTINTHGQSDTNVPVDLHMEHLNKRLKGMMRGLGSNITPESVQRASKALGIIEAVCGYKRLPFNAII